MTENEKDIGFALRLIEQFRQYKQKQLDAVADGRMNAKHNADGYDYMVECLEMAVNDSLEGKDIVEQVMLAIMEFTECNLSDLSDI